MNKFYYSIFNIDFCLICPIKIRQIFNSDNKDSKNIEKGGVNPLPFYKTGRLSVKCRAIRPLSIAKEWFLLLIS